MRTIAYFVYNLNSYSGASQQALLLAQALRLPIIIFNRERAASFSVQQKTKWIKVVNLPRSKLCSSLIVLFYILRYNCKVLHLHGFFKHGILIGAILRRKVILKTTLLGEDDFQSLGGKVRRRWVLNWLLRHVDLNVCLTPQLKNINQNHISKGKIKVIPNGVEMPGSVLAEKDNTFCFVGLICERKGAYESINFYLENYRSLSGSIMYVVGPESGSNESSKKYVEMCRDLVSAHNAQSQVIFTGNLEKSHVSEILWRSKALIFLSKREGMPNVVLEAMANNCMPITLGLDGVSEAMLGKGLNEKLSIPDPSTCIPSQLLDLAISDKNAYLRAKAKFSIEKVARAYKNIYAEI